MTHDYHDEPNFPVLKDKFLEALVKETAALTDKNVALIQKNGQLQTRILQLEEELESQTTSEKMAPPKKAKKWNEIEWFFSRTNPECYTSLMSLAHDITLINHSPINPSRLYNNQ